MTVKVAKRFLFFCKMDPHKFIINFCFFSYSNLNAQFICSSKAIKLEPGFFLEMKIFKRI